MVLPSRLMSWSMTTLMRLGFTGRASGSELLCATVAVKYDPRVFDSSRGLEAGEGRGLGVTQIVEPSMVTKKSLVCLAPGAFSRNVKFCHFERLPFMRIGGLFGAGLLVAASAACCGKFECWLDIALGRIQISHHHQQQQPIKILLPKGRQFA